jgi:hypothetical protein
MTTIDTSAPQTLSTEERADVLASTLRSQTSHGWRVVSQTQTDANLEKGKNTSHGLHIFLSIITVGLWAIFVWLPLTIFAGLKHRRITVDPYGKVTIS